MIVVHNEAAIIGAKLANLEALAYPRDQLHVIVVSDGSDDGTNALIASHAGPHARRSSCPSAGSGRMQP